MAMNGINLGDRIANIITHSDAPPEMKASIRKLWEDICVEIVKEVRKADITIPEAQVIISVSGGSGAPAVGVPNPTAIKTDIDKTSA